jgi:hypothetical protein
MHGARPTRRALCFLASESQITRAPLGTLRECATPVNGPASQPLPEFVKTVLTVSAHRCPTFGPSTGQPRMITLGNAAKQLGISKPALSKAISRGHLSAQKREDGSFSIDPAELMRWWEGARHRFQPPAVFEFQGATPSEDDENGAANGSGSDPEVNARLAALEEQVKGLRELLDEVKRSREQAESDRDHWRDQAARAVKALPAPDVKSDAEPASRRSWWRLAG